MTKMAAMSTNTFNNDVIYTVKHPFSKNRPPVTGVKAQPCGPSVRSSQSGWRVNWNHRLRGLNFHWSTGRAEDGMEQGCTEEARWPID